MVRSSNKMTYSVQIANKYDCKVNQTKAWWGILDPCNCSTYYVERKHNWERNVCWGEKLWNFKFNYCDEPKNVIDGNLCDPAHPWERCQELTDTQRNILITKCKQEGSYTGLLDGSHSDTSASKMAPTLVSRETQLANVHLMFASMFAGCVITLIIVAMLMEFCNFTRTSMKTPAKTEKLSDKPIPVAGSEAHVTDGERESALYEDIKEEEDIPSTEINQVYPHRSRTTHKPSESGSRTLASTQHRRKRKAPGTPAKLQTHMVPKTRSKAMKKEKGGHIERPPLPPQLVHKDSVGYIHPVYH